MDNSLKIAAFGNLTKSLGALLKSNFPEDPMIKLYETKINCAMMFDPSLAYEMFKESIEPYREKIISCDEAFFIGELTKLSSDIPELSAISKYWKDPRMTRELKARIFIYLNKILKTM